MGEKLNKKGDSIELNKVIEPKGSISEEEIYKNLPEEGPFNEIKDGKKFLRILENKLELLNKEYADLLDKERESLLTEADNTNNPENIFIKKQIKIKTKEIKELLEKIEIVKTGNLYRENDIMLKN